MAATRVMEDALLVQDSRSSNSSEAVPTLTPTGEKRQKKWAPRVRTGCTTCRARRIKCDEIRPVCRHCNRSRRACHYALPTPLYGSSASSYSNDSIQQLWPPKQNFYVEVKPIDWEFREALRFYFEVILADLPSEAQRIPLSCFLDENFPQELFKGNIISTQLERASKARGRVLRPGQDPAFKTSWARYFQSVSLHINCANQFLEDDSKNTDGAPAAFPILQLLILDLAVNLSHWKAHLQGFLAYVKSRGGPSEMMSLPKPEMSRLSTVLSFTMQLNTTCPAHRQIKGSDGFTDEEIRTLIDFDPQAFEPCPVEFHLARVRITRLRVSIASNKMSAEHARVMLNVRDIFDALWLFDMGQYVMQRFGDKDPETREQARVMGRVYALAIRLYGILTLPQSSVAAWAISSPGVRDSFPTIPGCGLYETLRRRHRDELLGILREQWGTFRLKKWFGWPLAVVGVAVVDDVTANKVFVDESLFSIWKIAESHTSSIAALEKLRIFWLSGKTSWEDCFDEPIPFSIW